MAGVGNDIQYLAQTHNLVVKRGGSMDGIMYEIPYVNIRSTWGKNFTVELPAQQEVSSVAGSEPIITDWQYTIQEAGTYLLVGMFSTISASNSTGAIVRIGTLLNGVITPIVSGYTCDGMASVPNTSSITSVATLSAGQVIVGTAAVTQAGTPITLVRNDNATCVIQGYKLY